MRSLFLIGTVAVLISGCASGDSGQTNGGKADEAHAAHDAHAGHGGPPSPRGPEHPHSFNDSIPAPYHGVYDASLEACARPSIDRLTISARELRFHESLGAVRSVAYGGLGAIAVEADYEGEGQRWRNLRILKLSDNDTRLTVQGDGGRLERVRCPQRTR
jgi:hypothetical protein